MKSIPLLLFMSSGCASVLGDFELGPQAGQETPLDASAPSIDGPEGQGGGGGSNGSAESGTGTITDVDGEAGPGVHPKADGSPARTIALINITTSNTLVGTKPAGTASGTVLIAQVVSYDDQSQTITAPSGWTLVKRYDAVAVNYMTMAIYSRPAGGSEPSTYTWTSNRNSGIGVTIAAYSGVDTATPVDASISTNSGALATLVTVPSISPSMPGEMLGLAALWEMHRLTGRLTGMTSEIAGTVSDGGQFDYFDQLLSSSGATGDKTGNLTGADNWSVIMFSLKPSLALPVSVLPDQ